MNNEYYLEILNGFFNTIETRNMRKEDIGKAYIEYFYKTNHININTSNLTASFHAGIFSNVGVIADEADLAFITKRVPLVSDMTLLTNNNRGGKYILCNSIDRGSYDDNDIETHYARCPLQELGAWLVDCKPMLLQGKLFYLPNIMVQHTQETYWGGVIDNPPMPWNKDIADFFLDGKQLSYVGGKDIFKTIKPIMTLKLPVIEGTSLKDFTNITAGSADTFECFRDLLKARLIELDSELENFGKSLIKLEIEIRDGLRKVEAELSLIKKKRAFGLAGAALVTCSAFLYALPSIADISALIAKILGTSGGVMVAGKTLQEYLMDHGRIKSSPYYYLWLLKNNG
jgi:hypothetical protein